MKSYAYHIFPYGSSAPTMGDMYQMGLDHEKEIKSRKTNQKNKQPCDRRVQLKIPAALHASIVAKVGKRGVSRYLRELAQVDLCKTD